MPPLLFPLGGLHVNTGSAQRRGVGPTLHGTFPLPARGLTLSGVSRDSSGAPLAGCTCTLFRVVTSPETGTGQGTVRYVQVAQTVSDGSGAYSFAVGFDGPYRVTFDLDGAPVRAGLTLNTLAGS